MSSSSERSSDSKQTLLILGASGDLSARLLLPGLGGLLASGGGEGISLVGSDVKDWDDKRWRERVAESFAAGGAGGDRVDAVARSTRYVKADATAESDWRKLLDACDGRVVAHFALPPAITERACQALTGLQLPVGSRLVFEKPFGTDTASAEALNQLVTGSFRRTRCTAWTTSWDIDGHQHRRCALREPDFGPLLNAEHVESVDIVFDETLGLEGRAGYYDHAGALVDMIQSHLLQVLALVTMDLRAGSTNATSATPRRRCCAPPGCGTTIRSPPDPGPLHRRRDRHGSCPRTSTSPASADARPRRWPRSCWRLTRGAGPGCRSGCAPARHSATRDRRSWSPQEPRHIPAGFTGGDSRTGCTSASRSTPGRGLDLDVNGPGDPKVSTR